MCHSRLRSRFYMCPLKLNRKIHKELDNLTEVLLVLSVYIEDITQRPEDMNFIFGW